MTRKKVKLAFIANDSSRKATFKKRKKGLMKKVNELATLCGITACAVIYSPYDTNPEVWPSNAGVQRVINELRTLPEMDQHKKMVDQETFLRQRIAKATEHLKRQRKDNREIEMTQVMYHCMTGEIGEFHLNIMDLNDLGYLIDQFLKDIHRRMEIMQDFGIEIGESSHAAHGDDEVATKGVGTITVVAATSAPTAMVVSEANFSSSSAAYFNSSQQHHYQPPSQPQPPQPQPQQFHYLPAPHVGYYEPQLRNWNMSQIQNHTQQQWLMEMMNRHPEQLSYIAEQMGLTVIDENQQYHLYHQSLQQQQILDDSFIAPTAVSNSIIPAASNRYNHHYQPQPQP
ncbi:hypothetical protein AALP_AA7G160600 [Arabis alpina]|uniref:MADS-box domain-containing protein n=1 Tax=Arabis alpina TaxID=50452 RepID=A0A087GIE6_ARAAL|nr:hypothetical protein AALP_AA7G160600 [Arabis alpina]